jgi:hypothetical protein
MGFQGPFLRLCLRLAKLRFPAAETGVGGTLGNNFWEYQSRLRRRSRIQSRQAWGAMPL